jgi:osmotically-inducible protein OsmY
MKHVKLWPFLFAALLSVGSMSSCKNKAKDGTSTPSTTTTTADTNSYTAPVQVSTDDNLRAGVRDATKDYPGVTATVNDGEVTLTGSIERDKLSGLMQSIQGLSPKKVNNQLTIK